jgi:hypothetical protein
MIGNKDVDIIIATIFIPAELRKDNDQSGLWAGEIGDSTPKCPKPKMGGVCQDCQGLRACQQTDEKA